MSENIPPTSLIPQSHSNKHSDMQINFSQLFSKEGMDLYHKMNDKERDIFNDF